MKNKTTVRVGGVPEHFNLPWRLAIDANQLAHLDIDISWQDFPGGTGSMVKALLADEVDIAMLLTEGALKGLQNNDSYEILSFYTQTPLLWGVHVPAESNLRSIEQLENVPFAISRFGSGSHLMARVFAKQQGWDLDTLEFQVVGGIEGARKHFKLGNECIFLWEKYMTKPLVDQGEFRRVLDRNFLCRTLI